MKAEFEHGFKNREELHVALFHLVLCANNTSNELLLEDIRFKCKDIVNTITQRLETDDRIDRVEI